MSNSRIPEIRARLAQQEIRMRSLARPRRLPHATRRRIMSKVWFITGASRGIGAEIAKAALGVR